MAVDTQGGIVRDLVSPMWRTTWDAHGMVGNLTDVYTGVCTGVHPSLSGHRILGVVSRFKRLDQDVEQGQPPVVIEEGQNGPPYGAEGSPPEGLRDSGVRRDRAEYLAARFEAGHVEHSGADLDQPKSPGRDIILVKPGRCPAKNPYTAIHRLLPRECRSRTALARETCIMNRRLTAIVEREGDGYVALCPEVDVASQGETVAEARDNLAEALALFFETAPADEANRRLRGEVYVTQIEVVVG